jgi:hypothetical protein
MKSKYLNSLALKGLNKVGDILVPGFEELPAFSSLGCSEHVDRIVEDLPPSDRDGVGILFMVFYFVPAFILRGLFGFMERNADKDILGGDIFRMIRMGVRGIVFSLYYSGWTGTAYSGKSPLDIIGYQLTVIRD